jgi:predicted ATPase
VLSTLAIAGYRSIRELVVPLRRLNIVCGANGSGKSNLYRALRLLADIAHGRVIAALAAEGGLDSTLWAGLEEITAAVRRGDFPLQGTRRKRPVSLRLGFAAEPFGYAIDLGLPQPTASMFAFDPEIKREVVWNGAVLRPASLLAERRNAFVRLRGDADWQTASAQLANFDSMISQIADPRGAPELLLLRETMRAWRFYDHLRSDAHAPARQARIGTRTPVLGNDGADAAAAVQTIREIGAVEAFDAAIDAAFPGSQVEVEAHAGGIELVLRQPGLLRGLRAAEWSDGTLRYVLMAAALLTPRPPPLMVFNEPETSLHPDLLPALGALLQRAARDTQLIVVTHANRLVASLDGAPDAQIIRLQKDFGATIADELVAPPWVWPQR